ncbi:MAG TPA: tetratricopeptide repeat protein [Terriglobia bacterium]|nr:tetratricopeptide repeat protein [Terriglobia bacterium]
MGEKASQPFQLWFPASRNGAALLILGALLTAESMLGARLAAPAKSGQDARAAHLATITIDYPLDGSIFPPEITPPTFIWRDAAAHATLWQIDIAFVDGSAELHFHSAGERLAIGEIDPRCVSSTNELPKLTPEQAQAHTWIPTAEVWEAIKQHSVADAAVITISGFSEPGGQHAVSRGRATIHTSKDPVGAPIFYRDVPLMPSETEKGIIKPLAPNALHLVQWRLRDIAKPESRVVLKEMPTCGNCHSFSLDGKTMGMDLDGPANNKGLYAIVSVKPQISIRNQDVISWSSLRDDTASTSRIGFMSQISPDGRYVLTNYRGQTKDLSTGYFTVNFKDYRFLQVFYPTRSIVAWYNRATGRKQSLPGADDPRYVQTNAVWSPDGKYVVFVRADAKDPYPPGNKMPEHANDPEEPPIQYDLYRIPFNDGKGGQPVAIAGASHNGMSNSFPKVSPEGRWIVFVKCRNAQLMRPDSQLFIVPATGGVARRMRCNTSLMNSWHSFSPNGRWLVFSSKSRSPYTQMFLTHLDADGNDSPAILIDNSTAANRAVNIPEFVNIPPDGLMAISTPAVDVYKEVDRVTELENRGQIDAAIVGWKELIATNPDDARMHNNLGTALTRAGRPAEAIPEFEKALELDPEFLRVYFNLGRALLVGGRSDRAIVAFEKGLQFDSESADLHYHLGLALASKNRIDEAKAEFARSLQINPQDANAHFALGVALASQGNGDAAITEYHEALRLNPQNELTHVNLGAALKEKGDLDGAIAEYREALRMDPKDAMAHYNLGASLGDQGNWDGQVAEEREALQLNPQIPGAHRELGLGLARKGDPEAAIAEYHEALRLNPNDEIAHLNLGLALANKGDWDLAIAEEHEALRLDPKDETVHVYLGAMLGQKGDRDGAIAEYREALRLNPANHLAHYDLGVALEKEGDRAGALQEYRAAYRLNPQASPYRRAYERLSLPDKP